MDNNLHDADNQSFKTSNDEFIKVNLKDFSKDYKYFFKSFFTNPISCLKSITKSNDNKFLNISFFILIFWIFITLIHSLLKYNYVYDGFSYFLLVLRDLTIPILSVGFLSLIIYCVKPNKEDDITLSNSIASIIVCKIPIIISSFISLITLISSKAYFITKPISYFCSIVSILLTFFAVKFLYKESEDARTFKAFLVVEAIFYIVYIFLSFLDIYLIWFFTFLWYKIHIFLLKYFIITYIMYL